MGIAGREVNYHIGHYVRPNKWDNVIDIFDNRIYSLIWGRWLGRGGYGKKCLGFRWNGSAGKNDGYPKVTANEGWICLPEELNKAILLELLNSDDGRSCYKDNVKKVLSEFYSINNTNTKNDSTKSKHNARGLKKFWNVIREFI